MRVLKKLNAALALALTLTLVAPISAPVTPVAVAEAATVKINKTKKTLKVGQTYQLKITGTKKTVKWKSSKKAVATVSSKGKVKAKAVGKTNITATVGGKTYKCKITVKAADNPALKNAPFSAKEINVNGLSFVTPKDWFAYEENENGTYAFGTAPTENSTAMAMITYFETGEDAPDYEIVKEGLVPGITEETLKAELESKGFIDPQISDLAMEDVETKIGTAFKYSYTVAGILEEYPITCTQSVYTLMIDNYFIMATGIDYHLDDITEPTVLDVTDYMVKSLIKK